MYTYETGIVIHIHLIFKMLDDGRLMATSDPKAPITLARMILARGPLFEYEATRVFLALSAIAGLLAVFTSYLIGVVP